MRYFVSVKIQSTLCCPRCHGKSIKKNGTKHDGKQNYLCRDCNRQFIGDHNLTYPGCHSGIDRTILKMLVRNCSIREISEITGCSRYKVQKGLKISQHTMFFLRKIIMTLWKLMNFGLLLATKRTRYDLNLRS